MCPFELLEDLKKSGYLEDLDKRRFQAKLDGLENEETKTFTVRLWWKDRLDQSGAIFIQVEGARAMHAQTSIEATEIRVGFGTRNFREH